MTRQQNYQRRLYGGPILQHCWGAERRRRFPEVLLLNWSGDLCKGDRDIWISYGVESFEGDMAIALAGCLEQL
jgi:hypothetical protein